MSGAIPVTGARIFLMFLRPLLDNIPRKSCIWW